MAAPLNSGSPWAVPIVGIATCSPLDNTSAMTLADAVKAGKVSVKVVGDGTTTSHVELRLKNKGGQPLLVTIPRFQVLVPQDGDHQLMLITRESCVTLRPGAEVTTQVPTLCISFKTVKPPGPGTVYSPGEHPNPQEFRQITNIVETAEKLGQSGEYDGLLISEGRRVPTVTQLTVWMLEGRKSGKPEDQVTAGGIGEDVLRTAQITRESLSPEQQQAFDEGVKAIFTKADFTLKRSQAAAEGADTPNAGELISDEPPQAPPTPVPPDTKAAVAKQPTVELIDGEKLILTYPDGTRVTVDLREKTSKGGSNLEYTDDTRPDGLIKKAYWNGTSVLFDPKTKQRVIRLADGTLVREFPAGEGKPPLVVVQSPVVKTLPDGTKITTEPDGTTRTRFPNGDELVRLPDGNSFRVPKSGGPILDAGKR